MDSLLALVIGFAVGGVFYYFDFKQGLGPYRSWYKLTHKDPLPKEIERGFVYQQNFSGKLYTGIILTLLVTLIIILTGSQNMLVQLLFGAFILVGMMLSFYLAPLIFRHGPAQLNKIQKAVEKIDQFEKEIRPPEKKPE